MSEETNTQTTQTTPQEGGQTPPKDENLLDATQTTTQETGEGQGNGEGQQGEAKENNLLDADALDRERKAEEDKVPEQYGEFKLPEGFVLEGEQKEQTLAAFRELGLSQKKAQSLIDMHCELLKREDAERQEALANTVRGWRESVRSRPEYEEERALAVRAMRAFVKTPEEIEFFRDGGIANHPVMWGLMVKAGRLIAEDNLGRGGGASPVHEDGKFHVDMATLN